VPLRRIVKDALKRRTSGQPMHSNKQKNTSVAETRRGTPWIGIQKALSKLSLRRSDRLFFRCNARLKI
jgi:hypothetical protein